MSTDNVSDEYVTWIKQKPNVVSRLDANEHGDTQGVIMLAGENYVFELPTPGGWPIPDVKLGGPRNIEILRPWVQFDPKMRRVSMSPPHSAANDMGALCFVATNEYGEDFLTMRWKVEASKNAPRWFRAYEDLKDTARREAVRLSTANRNEPKPE